VVALAAMPVLAHAVMAGRGLEVLLVAIIDQRVESIDALDDDVAAASAIAAIGPAEFDEFLAQKADRAGATIAGADKDLRLVEKFHVASLATAPCSSVQRMRVNRVSIWRRSS